MAPRYHGAPGWTGQVRLHLDIDRHTLVFILLCVECAILSAVLLFRRINVNLTHLICPLQSQRQVGGQILVPLLEAMEHLHHTTLRPRDVLWASLLPLALCRHIHLGNTPRSNPSLVAYTINKRTQATSTMVKQEAQGLLVAVWVASILEQHPMVHRLALQWPA
jgi:hypothetical protein